MRRWARNVRPLPFVRVLNVAHGFTVATICRRFDGVAKPPGGTTLSVLVPTAAGSNAAAVSGKNVHALNVTGLTVIVPVAALELVTVTLTGGRPPRIA